MDFDYHSVKSIIPVLALSFGHWNPEIYTTNGLSYEYNVEVIILWILIFKYSILSD